MITNRQLIFVLVTSFLISFILSATGFAGLTLRYTGLLFIAVVISITWYYPLHEESENFYDLAWFLFPPLMALLILPLLNQGTLSPVFFLLSLLFAILLAAPPLLLLIRKKLFTSA